MRFGDLRSTHIGREHFIAQLNVARHFVRFEMNDSIREMLDDSSTEGSFMALAMSVSVLREVIQLSR